MYLLIIKLISDENYLKIYTPVCLSETDKDTEQVNLFMDNKILASDRFTLSTEKTAIASP
ncbi:hypothetical protein [Nostoc sp.]|uniref:hypothetical protein n=1 Tax=Nostoc sp. TaxID=1180 RepID=UPI002FFCF2AD